MFPYIVGGFAILLFFYQPVVEFFSPDSGRVIPHTPRPAINESLLAIDAANETAPLNCPEDAYSVHILSKAPLVIYVENFISKAERDNLLELSEPLFTPSTLTSDGRTTYQDASVRDSAVALLPRTDAVRCVERRALALQGWRRDLWVERLRTQRYVAAGHYAHHFDWGSGARGWGRVSSMMVWVAAENLEGGGTEFPLLRKNGDGDKWCRWVECPGGSEGRPSDESREDRVPEEEDGLGVTFKPVAGNAVFWENFRPDGTGRGWEETWHAGLPVKSGVKVGLNIWSWGRLD
ncbi:uncharacterized protein JN550_000155 [Neoarthrinium moseri]|uniref:uncharacterized protein n=1 Tax=Neoarthrinium moseri TaxID=1658444 RepID=UPI001FDD4EA4|nr:uncharacterized protein JN550_000155 [Neoarthrinium moseri]KAI1877973.1 hypothetical protein JN550_000155 [Neoarthrinium moseri]